MQNSMDSGCLQQQEISVHLFFHSKKAIKVPTDTTVIFRGIYTGNTAKNPANPLGIHKTACKAKRLFVPIGNTRECLWWESQPEIGKWQGSLHFSLFQQTPAYGQYLETARAKNRGRVISTKEKIEIGGFAQKCKTLPISVFSSYPYSEESRTDDLSSHTLQLPQLFVKYR